MKTGEDLSRFIKVPKNPKDKKAKEIEPKDLIMINCKSLAEDICDILDKETSTYRKDKDSDQPPKPTPYTTEVKRILRYLEGNFEIDLFAEEFIKAHGISYLDKIITYNKGNIRSYGLLSILKLLDFENAFDYFNTRLEILSNLFNVAITEDSENIKANQYSLDIIIKIIGKDENKDNKVILIIDAAEKYAKKTHTELFQGIVNNLIENQTKYAKSALDFAINPEDLSKEQQIELMYRTVDKAVDFFYSDMSSELLTILTHGQKEKEIFGNLPLFKYGKKLFAALFNLKESDKEVILTLVSIITLINAPRLMPNFSLQLMNQRTFHQEDVRIIRNNVRTYMKALLQKHNLI
jgi:hypothetical protein